MLEKEFNFWLSHRTNAYFNPNTNEEVQFFQYRATAKAPRPESYREDMELVKELKTDGTVLYKRKQLLFWNSKCFFKICFTKNLATSFFCYIFYSALFSGT